MILFTEQFIGIDQGLQSSALSLQKLKDTIELRSILN